MWLEGAEAPRLLNRTFGKTPLTHQKSSKMLSICHVEWKWIQSTPSKRTIEDLIKLNFK